MLHVPICFYLSVFACLKECCWDKVKKEYYELDKTHFIDSIEI